MAGLLVELPGIVQVEQFLDSLNVAVAVIGRPKARNGIVEYLLDDRSRHRVAGRDRLPFAYAREQLGWIHISGEA